MEPKIEDMPGMKARELIDLGPCKVCGEKLLAAPRGHGSGDLTFYVLTLKRVAWLPDKLKRAAGMEMTFGPVASVLGPDEDLAKVFSGPTTVAVHERCADKLYHLAVLTEKSCVSAE